MDEFMAPGRPPPCSSPGLGEGAGSCRVAQLNLHRNAKVAAKPAAGEPILTAHVERIPPPEERARQKTWRTEPILQ